MHNLYTHPPIEPDQSVEEFLDTCITIANAKLLTNVRFPISFVEHMYAVYVAYADYFYHYAKIMIYIENDYTNCLDNQEKKLTFGQFKRKLNRKAKRIISLRPPKELQ